MTAPTYFRKIWGRFQGSGLAPSPKNFSEILDPNYQIEGISHVVFCKKNARDLEKFTDKIESLGQVVVIDDEADYATPNAKINRQDKTRTKINELIKKFIYAMLAYNSHPQPTFRVIDLIWTHCPGRARAPRPASGSGGAVSPLFFGAEFPRLGSKTLVKQRDFKTPFFRVSNTCSGVTGM